MARNETPSANLMKNNLNEMRSLKNTVSATMSSFRRKPESSAFNNFLDSGSSPE